jgi:hypothetical protein
MSELRREVLPIPDAKYVGVTPFEATDPDASYPPITPLRPPGGAPNVLVILLDDASRSRQYVTYDVRGLG